MDKLKDAALDDWSEEATGQGTLCHQDQERKNRSPQPQGTVAASLQNREGTRLCGPVPLATGSCVPPQKLIPISNWPAACQGWMLLSWAAGHLAGHSDET